jgi:hypothetical protein
MRITSVILSLLIACSCWCCAEEENLIRNSDFSQVSPVDPQTPENWQVPAGGLWTRIDNARDGKPALRYRAENALSEPVRQQAFCRPNAEYELRATIKSDGVLTPVLRIVDLQAKTEIALLRGSNKTDWNAVSAKFRHPGVDVALELYADEKHLAGEAAPAGEAWFADVGIDMIAAGAQLPTMPDLGENIALGKTYTMQPAPNYSLCTEAGDSTQLTDGEFSKGYFWASASTVGWRGKGYRQVKIDLGNVQPVKGISVSSAFGVASVRLPESILVYVSDDDKTWHLTGDLLRQHVIHTPLPEYGTYQPICLWTDKLEIRARYVQLCLLSIDYVFIDEIHIYRGDDSWLQKPLPGEPVTENMTEYLAGKKLPNDLLQKQLRRDLAAVVADIAEIPQERQVEFAEMSDKLRESIENMPLVDFSDFCAVLPQNDLEREIFQLQAAVWRAHGKRELRIWQTHRWDPLEPSQEPAENTDDLPQLAVHMMNNEHRSEVFNLTNASPYDKTVRIRVSGLPGGENPAYLRVREVLTVATKQFHAVSAALPEARRIGRDYAVTVPSGMTRQVWLSFNPDGQPLGIHQGAIEIRANSEPPVSLPLALHIYQPRFPDETSLLLCGWDYTNADYYMGKHRHAAMIAHLREYYVNTPWATAAALPRGGYDQEGNLTEEPDTANFDNWLEQWPNARMYMVFMNTTERFIRKGALIGTELFNKQVGEWARFWAQHLRDKGIAPNRLGLLLVDEPSNKTKFDIITAWSRAIKAAEPEFKIWNDPHPQNDRDCQEMLDELDIICPYRRYWLVHEDAGNGWYRQLFFDKQGKGKDLWFYSADGPARTFDPFSYYLLQNWHCFKIGAKGSGYWAFGDMAKQSCWNEYLSRGDGPYCPDYLDEESITPAKYMEAIREGVQDYEYLAMLRDRVNDLRKNGVDNENLQAAEKLLATACDRVLAMEKGENYRWDEQKDRTIADVVRIEILQALEKMAAFK